MNAYTRLQQWRRGLFYGWWIVVGGIGIDILQAGMLLQAYGLYMPLWQAEFGWSKTTLATVFAVQRLQSGLLGPVHGLLLQRFSPRRIMRIGLLTFAVGLMLLSRVDTLVAFILVFLLLAGGASLGGWLTTITVVVNWFERRRTTALALTQIGASIGGLLIPIVAWSLITFGWRTTSLVSGLLVLVLGVPLTQLMRTRPEDHGLRPDGAPAAPPRRAAVTAGAPDPGGVPAPPASPDFGTRDALRTPAFWLLSLGHGLALTVVSTVTVHLVVHLVEALEMSLPLASFVVAFLTGATLAGKVLGGFLGDRFDKRLVAAGAMVLHAGAILVLAVANGLALVLVFAGLHGLAWGIRGPLMGALRADYFGRRSFATIMGFSTSIIMIGSISGPILAGVIADRFGSYRPAFVLLALLAALGIFAFLLVRRPRPRS